MSVSSVDGIYLGMPVTTVQSSLGQETVVTDWQRTYEVEGEIQNVSYEFSKEGLVVYAFWGRRALRWFEVVLTVGMSRDQVTSLLGEPHSTTDNSSGDIHYRTQGMKLSIRFAGSDSVQSLCLGLIRVPRTV